MGKALGLSKLDMKLRRAKQKADYNKRNYWKIRNAVINYLGGKCSACEESDIKKLEVHHYPPTLRGGYKLVLGGCYVLNEWKRILNGEVKAILYCRECHVSVGHNGNTSELKKR